MFFTKAVYVRCIGTQKHRIYVKMFIAYDSLMPLCLCYDKKPAVCYIYIFNLNKSLEN